MAQTAVNFRLDENLKKEMEQVCSEMGMSMTNSIYYLCENGYKRETNTI